MYEEKMYKRVYLVLLIISSIWLIGCSIPEPSLLPLSPSATILAFGDSLTFGTGAPPDMSYPSMLAQLSKHKVINAGVPGEETKEALLRINNLLEKERPELVIICLGGNDMLRKRPYEQIKKNLAQIIRLIQQHHAQIILLAVPKVTLTMSPPEFYTELGDEYNIIVDNSTLPTLLKNNEYKSDYVHLNAKGYELLAEAIYQLLQKNGALN